MARFSASDIPTSYAPGRQYSLRNSYEGGELRDTVDETRVTGGVSFNEREILVLIHGYNNHYGEAAQAYVGFRTGQYALNPGSIRPPDLESLLADVHWPGDADWQRWDWLDFLCYPHALKVSIDAAQRLARFIHRQPNLWKVHFVAHSMGCRLALETIERLRSDGSNLLVGRVCLMAAAVPQFKVRHGGDLANAMSHAERVKVLYSPNDSVLKYAFPPGQTISGSGEGFFPTALGRDHPPPDTAGISADPSLVPNAGHSDYWGYRHNSASLEATRATASFFELGMNPRAIDQRVIEKNSDVQERRSEMPKRRVGEA